MYLRSHKQRYSSPIKDQCGNGDAFLVDNENSLCSSSDDSFLKTGDSTRSLLAPLYDDSFHDPEFKELPYDHARIETGKCKDNNSTADSLVSQSISSIHSANSDGRKRSPISSSCTNYESSVKTLSPSSNSESKHSEDSNVEKCMTEVSDGNMTWEQWLQKKMSEDIENLDLKRERKKYKAAERRRKEEEKKMVMERSMKEREHWLKKKDMEREKKFKQKKVESQLGSLKQREEKQLKEEKTAAKLREWEEDKVAKEKEKRKSLLEEKRKAKEECEKKKEMSETSYNRWLQNAKTKKNSRTTYGFSNGALFSYYDMGCSPAPSYNNPLPWVDVAPPPSKKQENKGAFMSPPLLWKEVEKRDPKGKKQQTKPKRVIVKHSCIDK